VVLQVRIILNILKNALAKAKNFPDGAVASSLSRRDIESKIVTILDCSDIIG
jgi:hypothetical protein